MPIDSGAFTQAMAQVPSPVSIVTTVDADGQRWGFTASSFCSLSLEPSLLLVCLAKSASSHQIFAEARHFLVNVLAEGHSGVALSFAKTGTDKFSGSAMVPCELGMPGLTDAAARVACTTHAVLDGGDHSILIGRAEDSFVLDRPPLMYYNRQFTSPQRQALAGVSA